MLCGEGRNEKKGGKKGGKSRTRLKVLWIITFSSGSSVLTMLRVLCLIVISCAAQTAPQYSYAQLRAFVHATPDFNFGLSYNGDTAVGFGFIMGHSGTDALTCPDSKCESRPGGAISFATSPEFTGRVNMTGTSTSPRVMVGAEWSLQGSAMIPQSLYQMCDATPPNQTSLNAGKLLTRSKKSNIEKSATFNDSYHFDFSPLAAYDGTGDGGLSITSSDSTALVLALQLFPYETLRTAKMRISFCATTTDECDTCGDVIIQTMTSADAPLLMPYGGPAGVAGRFYCASISLFDSLDGSVSITGGAIFGLASDVKKVLA